MLDKVYLIHSSEVELNELKSLRSLIRNLSYRQLQDALFENPCFRFSKGMYGSYRRINLLTEYYYNIVIKRLMLGCTVFEEIDKCVLDAVLKALNSYTTVEELINDKCGFTNSIFFHISDCPYKYKNEYKGKHTISIPFKVSNLENFESKFDFSIFSGDHADSSSVQLSLKEVFDLEFGRRIYHPEIAIFSYTTLQLSDLMAVCNG